MQGFTFFFYFNKQDCIKEKKAHKSTPVVYNELKKQIKTKNKGENKKTTLTLKKDPTNPYNQLRTKNSHECTLESTKKYCKGKNF